MGKIVEFEGLRIEVPEDATEQEIMEILSTLPKAEAKPAAGSERNFDRGRFDAIPVAGGGDNLQVPLNRIAQGKPAEKTSAGKAALLGAGEGIMGGSWLDEGAGAFNATIDQVLGSESTWREDFTKRREDAKRKLALAAEDQPLAYGASKVAGAIASGVALPMVKGPTMAATGLRTGAVYGGISGAGEGETLGERALNAGIGTAIGGTIGGGIGWVGDKLTRGAASRAGASVIDDMSLDDSAAMIPGKTLGMKTGDVEAQRRELRALNGEFGPEIQAEAQAARNALEERMRAGIERVGQEVAGDFAVAPSTVDAAEGLRQSVAGSVASQETENVVGSAAMNASRSNVAEGLGTAPGNAFEIGQTVQQNVQRNANAARRARSAAYQDFEATPGTFSADAVEGMSDRVRQGALGRQVVIDETTPNAMQAVRVLEEMSGMRRPKNLADPQGLPDPSEVVGVSVQGIAQVRKQLTALAKGAAARARAGDGSDLYAMREVIEQFDGQLEDAIQRGMFSGDASVLGKLRQARQMHAQFRRDFYRNGPGDTAGGEIEKIVREQRTPEDIANRLYNGTRIGEKGTTTMLAERLRNVVDPDVWGQVRRAYWDRLTQADGGGISVENAQTIAQHIAEFTGNRGRSTALAVFDPPQIDAMRNFGQQLQSFARQRNVSSEALQTFLEIAGPNMNPAKMADIITGGVSPKSTGKTDAAWRMLDATESLYGRNSQQFSLLQQALFRKLTDPSMGPQAMKSAMDSFLEGPGRYAAEKAFDPRQLAMLNRLRQELGAMVPNPNATNPSRTSYGTNRGIMDMIQQFAPAFMTAAGGIDAGATSWLAQQGLKTVRDGVNRARVGAQFEGRRAPSPADMVIDRAIRASRSATNVGSRAVAPSAGRLAPSSAGQAAAAEEERRP